MSMTLNVLIVGAGLAGLGAAIACRLEGHNVVVLEAAKELGEIGAGLQVTPNGTRLLRAWGIEQQVIREGCQATEMTIHRYSDGRILAQEKDLDKKMSVRYGSPFVGMHRGDLYTALLQKAEELGVQVKTDCRVLNIDIADSKVVVESGESFRGDLIVGADGLWSKCREALLGQDDPPTPTGDLAYRVVLRLDQLEDAELKALVANPKLNLWMGPKSHVVVYSIKAATMLNVVLLVPDDLPEHVRRQPASLDEMKAFFTGWDPLLMKILEQVEQVDKWKLMHRPAIKTWISDQGNFALIGDSCHPMLPYLGQGANCALEDGAALGRVLRDVENREDVPARLRLWEKERKSRGEAVALQSFLQRDANHMEDGPEQRARDEVLRSQMTSLVSDKSPHKMTDPEMQPWLFDYDAYAAMGKAMNDD